MTSRFFVLLLVLIPSILCGQNSQTIRGRILDSESLTTLPGAHVIIKGSEPIQGTSTDMDGNFILTGVPIGRRSLLIQAIGYDDAHLDNLLLSSGKELQIEVKLLPSFEILKEVTITAKGRDNEALNEMATLSARSFSVEETQRYAASAFDPSRMALSFAGVVSAGDDIENEISVRGNSPKGVLWRLEGIEIPNPNHFSDLGSSGGGISMLSSSTLSSSDFYTGAFPSEFGNATSGVFDLNLRNGNNEIREHSVMIGALGVEVATEGYISKESNASYLVNYRYSTLAALSLVFQPFGDVLPVYQDVSFKVQLPDTKLGSFSIFGLGGNNTVTIDAEPDMTLWEENDTDNNSFTSTQNVGIIGLKNVARLNDKAFVKTVAAFSINRYVDKSIEHDLSDFDLQRPYDITTFQDDQFTVNSSLNYKLDNRNTLKTGGIFNLKSYFFDYDYRDLSETTQWTNFIDGAGEATQYNIYAQWKRRLTEKWTSNIGLHLSYIGFNNTYSIEPRGALKYTLKDNSELSLAAGLHSKPEHISTYFLNENLNGVEAGLNPNRNLEIPKSAHLVTGYKFKLSENTGATIEAYYQYQFDIPVERGDSSIFSTINTSDIWNMVDRDDLVSDGLGRNYGIDVSVQRSFQNNYYFMCNASLYKSEFQTNTNKWLDSFYNGDYVTSILGGKEFKLKKKNRLFGINGKLITAGGRRYTPFVIEDNEPVDIIDLAFAERLGAYFRFDIGISYKSNRAKATHTILFDIQNVSNRLNPGGIYYDQDDMMTKTFSQTGIFPFVNYRIEFQGKRKALN